MKKAKGVVLGEGGLAYKKSLERLWFQCEGKGWNGNFIEISKIIKDKVSDKFCQPPKYVIGERRSK